MDYVTYHSKDRIGFITINRPEKRNALSDALVEELKEGFRIAENDDTVKVVVLQASGEVFCSGADLGYLRELQNYSYEENLADSEHLKDLFCQIYSLKKVVIASIQGHAIAGGCGLATVCDFSFAVPEAQFGYTEVRIGFIPAIVMVFLIRKIGEGKARQLLLQGDTLSAEQAKQFRLINYIVPSESLEEEVYTFAQKLITSNSANSMMLTKQMIAEVPAMRLEDALAYATEMNAKARASEDCKKGITAFLNKEKIIW
jgi:methylglutaconyl-CoA hydratase